MVNGYNYSVRSYSFLANYNIICRLLEILSQHLLSSTQLNSTQLDATQVKTNE